jgi:MOSC domain-containing protein YiiM
MWSGTVESIHLASAAKAPMQTVDQAEAIPGAGLQGDRYAAKQGTYSKPESDGPQHGRELTLIELESILAMRRDYGIALDAGGARRNIVTRGVPLNHLVGREFHVGGVRLLGIRLCEPCDHLQQLTGAGVLRGLRHRGGLRAQILNQGTIRVGDVIGE